MKQNRKPEYHKKDIRYRIVSQPNDQWVAQRNDGLGGTKTSDPWHDLHKPCTYKQANQIMHERGGPVQ